MDEHLRRHLTPPDDGRGFVEAVLFRAAGALARRRQAATDGPTWSLLEFWARPWLIAALLLIALAVAIPGRPWSGTAAPTPDAGLAASLLGGTNDSEVVLSVALGN